MNISEQQILLLAPNAAAAANGKKLSTGGKFSARCRNEADTVFWADCAGSGKNPYRVSVDFSLSDSAPTSRCSCPSRQFPCKHAVGLLYEIAAGKAFAPAAIPEELAAKIAKQAAKAAKKEEQPEKTDKPKKDNTAARKKKLRKQLEGLEMAQKMVDDLMRSGVGTLAGTSAQAFEQVAKDLGNYYLTGPQNAFTGMALQVRQIQQHPENASVHYAEALRILTALHATIKKSQAYLTEKLEKDDVSLEDSTLYEALGGIWRLEDLKAIGAFRENARLVQLSFDVSYDEARREYVERGFWLDLDRGTIDQTLNYRPLKALKYVKAEDSCFGLLEIPVLYEYPGERNRRIRWEDFTSREITPLERQQICAWAKTGVAEVVKTAKGQMKNTLLPKYLPALLPIGRIGMVGESAVLEDPMGGRLVLRDRREDGADHAAVRRLMVCPAAQGGGCGLFGLVFYDAADHRICLHPYSIITADEIIRLQY